jgi:CBS domain-containing protein
MNPARLPVAETLLRELTVADAMHRGIVSCPPSANLLEVAALLARNAIHCAVVTDDAGTVWGIVSDVDLMRGLGSPVPLTAGNLAALEAVAVAPDDELQRAAQLMAEHDVSHLIVRSEGAPVGIVSTLDVARAAAGTVGA